MKSNGQNWLKKSVVKIYLVLLIFSLIISCILPTNFNGEFWNSKALENETIVKAETTSLPVVENKENLKKLLASYIDKADDSPATYDNFIMDSKSSMVRAETTSMSKKADTAGEYSKTNVQVSGVDEADIVKTDGEYIYKVNMNTISIIKAQPASEMKEISAIKFENSSRPREIFIKDNYLVVIEAGYSNIPMIKGDFKILPIASRIKIEVYDISDKSNARSVRSFEIDGSYTTSRMIGDKIYIIDNQNIRLYKNMESIDVPKYSDSINGNVEESLTYDKIQYCPGIIQPNYINIVSLNLGDVNEKLNISSILGSGNMVYVSADNIYVAGVKQNYIYHRNYYDNDQEAISSVIYKFSMQNGSTKYLSKGEVKGTILNQFSMDEYDDNFRVATTEEVYTNEKTNLNNNVYVLDKDMKTIGSLEDIAKDEKIYSVRFMENRAYMVTFKLIDPLFAIDLSKPEHPTILGELKIPGFSDYLEPYDENHLIGFGRDTDNTTVVEGNEERAVPKGVKLALFDVTNPNEPKQLFVEVIGDKGTYSEILNNHKALLFSKDKNLLAFPISVNEANYNNVFNGAYVYSVDINNGFTLKAKITQDDMVGTTKTSSGKEKIYLGNFFINRIMYIRDVLYTISDSGVKATSLKDFKDISKLVITKN